MNIHFDDDNLLSGNKSVNNNDYVDNTDNDNEDDDDEDAQQRANFLYNNLLSDNESDNDDNIVDNLLFDNDEEFDNDEDAQQPPNTTFEDNYTFGMIARVPKVLKHQIVTDAYLKKRFGDHFDGIIPNYCKRSEDRQSRRCVPQSKDLFELAYNVQAYAENEALGVQIEGVDSVKELMHEVVENLEITPFTLDYLGVRGKFPTCTTHDEFSREFFKNAYQNKHLEVYKAEQEAELSSKHAYFIPCGDVLHGHTFWKCPNYNQADAGNAGWEEIEEAEYNELFDQIYKVLGPTMPVQEKEAFEEYKEQKKESTNEEAEKFWETYIQGMKDDVVRKYTGVWCFLRAKKWDNKMVAVGVVDKLPAHNYPELFDLARVGLKLKNPQNPSQGMENDTEWWTKNKGSTCTLDECVGRGTGKLLVYKILEYFFGEGGSKQRKHRRDMFWKLVFPDPPKMQDDKNARLTDQQIGTLLGEQYFTWRREVLIPLAQKWKTKRDALRRTLPRKKFWAIPATESVKEKYIKWQNAETMREIWTQSAEVTTTNDENHENLFKKLVTKTVGEGRTVSSRQQFRNMETNICQVLVKPHWEILEHMWEKRCKAKKVSNIERLENVKNFDGYHVGEREKITLKFLQETHRTNTKRLILEKNANDQTKWRFQKQGETDSTNDLQPSKFWKITFNAEDVHEKKDIYEVELFRVQPVETNPPNVKNELQEARKWAQEEPESKQNDELWGYYASLYQKENPNRQLNAQQVLEKVLGDNNFQGSFFPSYCLFEQYWQKGSVDPKYLTHLPGENFRSLQLANTAGKNITAPLVAEQSDRNIYRQVHIKNKNYTDVFNLEDRKNKMPGWKSIKKGKLSSEPKALQEYPEFEVGDIVQVYTKARRHRAQVVEKIGDRYPSLNHAYECQVLQTWLWVGDEYVEDLDNEEYKNQENGKYFLLDVWFTVAELAENQNAKTEPPRFEWGEKDGKGFLWIKYSPADIQERQRVQAYRRENKSRASRAKLDAIDDNNVYIFTNGEQKSVSDLDNLMEREQNNGEDEEEEEEEQDEQEEDKHLPEEVEDEEEEDEKEEDEEGETDEGGMNMCTISLESTHDNIVVLFTPTWTTRLKTYTYTREQFFKAVDYTIKMQTFDVNDETLDIDDDDNEVDEVDEEDEDDFYVWYKFYRFQDGTNLWLSGFKDGDKFMQEGPDSQEIQQNAKSDSVDSNDEFEFGDSDVGEDNDKEEDDDKDEDDVDKEDNTQTDKRMKVYPGQFFKSKNSENALYRVKSVDGENKRVTYFQVNDSSQVSGETQDKFFEADYNDFINLVQLTQTYERADVSIIPDEENENLEKLYEKLVEHKKSTAKQKVKEIKTQLQNLKKISKEKRELPEDSVKALEQQISQKQEKLKEAERAVVKAEKALKEAKNAQVQQRYSLERGGREPEKEYVYFSDHPLTAVSRETLELINNKQMQEEDEQNTKKTKKQDEQDKEDTLTITKTSPHSILNYFYDIHLKGKRIFKAIKPNASNIAMKEEKDAKGNNLIIVNSSYEELIERQLTKLDKKELQKNYHKDQEIFHEKYAKSYRTLQHPEEKKEHQDDDENEPAQEKLEFFKSKIPLVEENLEQGDIKDETIYEILKIDNPTTIFGDGKTVAMIQYFTSGDIHKAQVDEIEAELHTLMKQEHNGSQETEEIINRLWQQRANLIYEKTSIWVEEQIKLALARRVAEEMREKKNGGDSMKQNLVKVLLDDDNMLDDDPVEYWDLQDVFSHEKERRIDTSLVKHYQINNEEACKDLLYILLRCFVEANGDEETFVCEELLFQMAYYHTKDYSDFIKFIELEIVPSYIPKWNADNETYALTGVMNTDKITAETCYYYYRGPPPVHGPRPVHGPPPVHGYDSTNKDKTYMCKAGKAYGFVYFDKKWKVTWNSRDDPEELSSHDTGEWIFFAVDSLDKAKRMLQNLAKMRTGET